MNDKILALIIAAANDLNQKLENKIPIDRGVDAPLYGQEGVLDSLGLVSLLVSVEQSIEDQHHVKLTLADERAMSQKRSPFQTIGSLVEYVARLMRNGA
jgi:acyl carrier protein